MDSSKPYAPGEAMRRINSIVEDGIVRPSVHALRRMHERNIDLGDIRHALLHGRILRSAEWDQDHGEWKYRVEGTDVEGDDLIVITIIIDTSLSVIIVTVI